MNIKDYGIKDNLIKKYKDQTIARIIATHKDRYEIVCDKGQGYAQIKRGCYYDNPNSIYPTTGDFVIVEWNPNGDSMISETLKRESSFSRAASTSDRNHKLHIQHEQLVAANFDYVFIMQSLNNNFNLHRIERYLSLAWESGGIPVIILTKSDLVANAQEYVEQVKAIAFGVDVYAISCKNKEGLEDIEKYLSKGNSNKHAFRKRNNEDLRNKRKRFKRKTYNNISKPNNATKWSYDYRYSRYERARDVEC